MVFETLLLIVTELLKKPQQCRTLRPHRTMPEPKDRFDLKKPAADILRSKRMTADGQTGQETKQIRCAKLTVPIFELTGSLCGIRARVNHKETNKMTGNQWPALFGASSNRLERSCFRWSCGGHATRALFLLQPSRGHAQEIQEVTAATVLLHAGLLTTQGQDIFKLTAV